MNTNSKEKLNKLLMHKLENKQAIIILMIMIALLVLPIFSWQTTLSDSGTTSPLWQQNQADGSYLSTGNGTSGSPYIINTAEHLYHFCTQLDSVYNDKHFKLGQNILINNMNSTQTAFNGTPRAFKRKPDFKGVFDGDGCSIIGLYYEAQGTLVWDGIWRRAVWEDNLGLFEQLSGSASISAEVKNLNVYGKIKGGSGYIFGATSSSNDSDDVGGLVGRMNGNAKITNCSFTGEVETSGAGQYIGGIVGLMDGGNIENCSVTATITGASSNVGGISGGGHDHTEQHPIIIRGSSFAGKVIGTTNVGGIIGLTIYNDLIEGCAVTGTEIVSATSNAGGIVGKPNSGTVKDCSVTATYQAGKVSILGTGDNVGGIAGGDGVVVAAGYGEFKIINSAFTGTVKGKNNVGGIIGELKNSSSVKNSHFIGNVESASSGKYVGGIVGKASGGTIENCSAGGSLSGAVTVKGVSDNVGGIAGAIEGNDDKILNSFFNGKITGTNNVGGIVGLMNNANNLVQTCSISGIQVVDANNMVGGIVGKQNDGTVSQCQVFGVVEGSLNTVTGKQYTGGIVGGLLKGSIKESVFRGRMTGTTEVGGIAGKQEGAAKIEDSEVEGNIQGSSNVVGGIVGNLINGTIDRSIVRADISGSNNVGGIAGTFTNSKINQCQLDGNVTGVRLVGGIAGQTGGTARIENSSTISGSAINGTGGSSTSNNETRVGGIVGDHAGTICNSVNFANVQGKYAVGGIAGYLNGNGAAMANCVNTGEITVANSNGGGLVGKLSSNNNSSTVHKCVSWGKVLGNGSNKGSIGGFNFTNLKAKYNFYQTYSGAPNAYTNGNSGADNYAGAPVEGNDVDYSKLSWHGLVEGDGGWYVKFLNWPTDCGCIFDADEPPYYLDPNYDWMPLVNLDGEGQPPVEMDVCITSGMEYLMPTSPWEDGVVITNDSVLSIAYRFGVNIGCPPSRLALSFKISDAPDPVQLPIGTRITVMTKGKYYYTILTGTKERIQLIDFYEMGSTTDVFQGTSWGGVDDRDFLVSLDFTNVPKADRLNEGVYDIVFLPLYGTTLTEYPKMEIKKQDFDLEGAGGTNGFYVKLLASPETVDAYNHLVSDRETGMAFDEFGIEFYLEDENGAHWPLPIGSKVNGNIVTRGIPYQIFQFTKSQRYDFTIELPAEYEGPMTASAIVYASENPSLPRGGHKLTYGSDTVTFVETMTGDTYALKTSIVFANRFLDYSAADRSISTGLEIDCPSNAILKYTLQKKYGAVYSNMSNQVDKPLSISASTVNLQVPGGLEKGTYRFVITLYDKNGTAQTNSIENIIIK